MSTDNLEDFKTEVSSLLDDEAIDTIDGLIDEMKIIDDEYHLLVSEGKENWRGTKDLKERSSHLHSILTKWFTGQEELINKLKEDEGLEQYEELVDLIERNEKRASQFEKDNRTTITTYRNLIEELKRLRHLREEWNYYKLISEKYSSASDSKHNSLPPLERISTEHLVTAINSTPLTPVLVSQAKEWVGRNETEINQQMVEQGFETLNDLNSYLETITKDFDGLSEKGKQSVRGKKLETQIESVSELQKKLEQLSLLKSALVCDPSTPDDESMNKNIPSDVLNPPYYVTIFHDAENCIIPKSAKAFSVYQRTLHQILASYFGDMNLAKRLNLIKDISLKWKVVIRLNPNNKYHPSQTFLDELGMYGAEHVIPPFANQPDAVDNAIKRMMDDHTNNFRTVDPQVRSKYITVLISSDKDFRSEVLQMTRAQMHVIVICNRQTNQTFLSLANASLPVWEEIVGGNDPEREPKLSKEASPKDEISSQPEKSPAEIILSILPIFADFVDKKDRKISANFLGELYSSNPEFREQIRSVKVPNFCRGSYGVLEWEANTDKNLGYGYVKLTLLGKFYVFVNRNGGRIPASMFGRFKNQTPELPQDTKIKSFIAPCTLLNWTDAEKEYGYGFVSVINPLTGEVKSPSSQLSHFITVSKPKLLHIKKYPTELNNLLATSTQNIAFKLDDSKKSILLEPTDSDVEASAEEYQLCLNHVRSYLSDVLKEQEFEVVGVTKTQLFTHKPLMDVLSTHRAVVFPFIPKGEGAAAVEEEKLEEKDNLELTIRVTKLWFKKQSITNLPTKFFPAKLTKYLEDNFRISKFQVHLEDPKEYLFKLVFLTQKPLNILLSSRLDALSNGIVFIQKKEFSPKVKTPEGNPSPQVETLHYRLVYYAANEEQVIQEVKGEIDSLARVTETMSYHALFNGVLGKKEFLHHRWSYFEKLAEESYNVDLSNDSQKSLVEFSGRSQDVRGAKDGIVELMKSLAHHKFVLSKIDPDTLAALKYLIKTLYRNLRKNTRNSRSTTETEVEVEVDDDASEVSHETTQSTLTLPANVYCYWHPFFPQANSPTKGPISKISSVKKVPKGKTPSSFDLSHLELSIVSLHHHREQFEIFKSSISKLLASYVSITLSKVILPTSPRLPVLEIKNSFDLMTFQVRGGDIVISGSRSMVESAESYVTELLRGSALESLAVNLPPSPKSIMTAQFFRLNAMESTLANLCRTISTNFQGVTATIPGNQSQSSLTIFMLHGPKNVLPNALEFVLRELQTTQRNLIEKILPLQQHEIDFLLKVNDGICANDPVLIQFPSDEEDIKPVVLESTGDKVFLRGSGCLGRLSVTAVRCRFEDVGGVLGCESIINPANVRLEHVGGLARLIADAAGSNFTLDSASSIIALGQLRPGEARPLVGHELEQKFGISAVINLSVTPNSSGNQVPQSFRTDLRLSIKNALSLAEELEIVQLGIPGIGTGIYQWPAAVSAYEIVKAIAEWAKVNNPAHLRDIYLFDIDPNVVEEFYNAMSMINDTNVSTVASTVGERPTLRDHQWYRVCLPHEPEYNSEGSIPAPNASNRRYIPYDYDQVNQLEDAFLSGKPDCLLVGDFHGVKNGVSYLVNFAEKRQCNTSTNYKREVDRLPRTSLPPLYLQRCAEYEARQQHISTNVSRILLTDLQELNQDYEAPNDTLEGVRLYGDLAGVERAEKTIRALLLAGRCEGSFSIAPLKATRVSLSYAIDELTKLLARFNADFVRLENNDSLLIFSTLGDATLYQISTAGFNKITELMMNDLVIPLPVSWKSSDDEIKLVALSTNDEEYRLAAECFLQGFSCTILQIERVQNPCLYREYMKAKQKLADRRGGNPNELLLKHGTRSTPPSKIWDTGDHTNTYGFDPRYSAQGFFGKGAYFAEDTSYSDGYASTISLPDGTSAKQMFLAKVAAGLYDQKITQDRTLLHPSPGYDSVRGPITNSNQGIIIYELHRSYPAYLITYRK